MEDKLSSVLYNDISVTHFLLIKCKSLCAFFPSSFQQLSCEEVVHEIICNHTDQSCYLIKA